MKVSDKGVLEICEHEGIVPAPYKDSKGIWTYGIGHTAAAGGLDPREMNSAMPADIDAAIDRAIDVFRDDLVKYEERVNKAIKVQLKQHEFDALVSFDFNTGGIYSAKLTKAINSGNKSGAGFMGWLKPPEIIKRRKAEKMLFNTGNYDHNGDDIAVWKTDGKGNLKGILKVVDGAYILKRMNRADVAPTGGFWGAVVAILKGLFK